MSTPASAARATQHKFIVDSAPEAANVIRAKLGSEARVIAVRPVPRPGLGRFFNSPRLEVIAEVPAVAEPELPAEPEALTAPTSPAIQTSPTPSDAAVSATAPMNALARAYAAEAFTPPESESAPAASAAASPAANRFWSMLERAGLRRAWLEQLQDGREWSELASQPLSSALPRAAAMLLRQVAVPTLPLGTRCAFFGGPGAGVTTALCKQLARDPLARTGGVAVMKMESSRPNAAESLATVCEALNLPLVRSIDELAEPEAISRIYFDAPGLRLNRSHSLRAWMEEYQIESRVLVLNAAYESSLLQEYYARGEAAGATHVVFTHLDELPRWGKLWEFLLRGRLSPLFGSIGGSLAGECEPELLALLTRQTVGGGQAE